MEFKTNDSSIIRPDRIDSLIYYSWVKKIIIIIIIYIFNLWNWDTLIRLFLAPILNVIKTIWLIYLILIITLIIFTSFIHPVSVIILIFIHNFVLFYPINISIWESNILFPTIFFIIIIRLIIIFLHSSRCVPNEKNLIPLKKSIKTTMSKICLKERKGRGEREEDNSELF